MAMSKVCVTRGARLRAFCFLKDKHVACRELWAMLCQGRFGRALCKATIVIAPCIERDVVMRGEKCYCMHRLEDFRCALSD